MTEELARQGYIVAAVGHADGLRFKREKPLKFPDFGDAKSWDEAKFFDRREDMVALLDHLLKLNDESDSYLNGHVNSNAIGALGHSLGGYTALGLAGGWQQWHDKRIKAVVAMSPYSAPYLVNGNIANVQIPVMLQGGTWDFGITPFLPSIYDRLTCPRYYVVLKNENHFGWTNLASLGKTTKECVAQGNPELMTRYTLDFFDKHLQGKEVPRLVADEPRVDKLLCLAEGGMSSGNGNALVEKRLQK